jgi:hypothetical protein
LVIFHAVCCERIETRATKGFQAIACSVLAPFPVTMRILEVLVPIALFLSCVAAMPLQSDITGSQIALLNSSSSQLGKPASADVLGATC